MTEPDAQPPEQTAGAAATTTEAPEPAPTPADATTPVEGGTGTLDVIMDLDLPLTVRFGQTLMTLGALSRLRPGSEINLDRSASDPVELLVNGKVIARGDVVAVDGNYAVRITNVVSPSERIVNVGG